MAVRNLIRNRRTNLIIGIIMTIGLIFVVIALGFIGGIKTNYEKLILGTMSGDISITTEDDTFQMTKDIEHLSQLDGVVSVAPRLYTSGYLFLGSDGDSYETITCIGIDEEQDEQLVANFSRNDNEFTLSEGMIAITKQKAEILGLEVGDHAQIVLFTSAGQSEKVDVTVSCIYEGKSSNSAIEAWTIMKISDMRKIMDLEKNEVTTVKIFASEKIDLAKLLQTISSKLGETQDDYDLETWEETSAADMMRTPTIYSAILLGFSGVLFVLISIGITSVLFSALLGKTKEYGVMQTLGMKRGQIAHMNFVEMFMLITISMGIGLVICLITVGVVNANEIALASDAMKFTFGGNVLTLKLSLQYCLIPILFIYLLSICISFMAVRKVTKIPVLKAMNE